MRGVLADLGVARSLTGVPANPKALAEVRAMETQGERDAWLRRFEAGVGDILLLDGHLRAEEIRDQPLPVELLDLDEREQAELLATFDPSGDLATADRTKFLSLAEDFNSTNPAVQALVADLAAMKLGGAADALGLEGDGATGGGDAAYGQDAGDEGPGAEGPEDTSKAGSLADRFGVAPFSVLNAREGWWQTRKAAWIALGLRSEMGRGGQAGEKLTMSATIQALKPSADQAAKRGGGGSANAGPGGSARPAMKTQGGKTVRGDGRGHAMK